LRSGRIDFTKAFLVNLLKYDMIGSMYVVKLDDNRNIEAWLESGVWHVRRSDWPPCTAHGNPGLLSGVNMACLDYDDLRKNTAMLAIGFSLDEMHRHVLSQLNEEEKQQAIGLTRELLQQMMIQCQSAEKVKIYDELLSANPLEKHEFLLEWSMILEEEIIAGRDLAELDNDQEMRETYGQYLRENF
jgi:hypothetical protein